MRRACLKRVCSIEMCLIPWDAHNSGIQCCWALVLIISVELGRTKSSPDESCICHCERISPASCAMAILLFRRDLDHSSVETVEAPAVGWAVAVMFTF